jgi:hypothetical protein
MATAGLSPEERYRSWKAELNRQVDERVAEGWVSEEFRTQIEERVGTRLEFRDMLRGLGEMPTTPEWLELAEIERALSEKLDAHIRHLQENPGIWHEYTPQTRVPSAPISDKEREIRHQQQAASNRAWLAKSRGNIRFADEYRVVESIAKRLLKEGW